MPEKLQLLSLDDEALKKFVCDELGEKPFRAKQIREWLNRGATVAEMGNLSLKLRTRLDELAIANPIVIDRVYTSQIDETEKFLYRLTDGNLIEGVVMRYHYGDTLCVSTQVGCRMGCAFCASTLQGRVRNLSPGEILGQVVAVNRYLREKDASRRVHNIVLMGSGEPFDNYENVIAFLRLVNSESGLNISLRNISLSTCGLADRIDRFSKEGLPVTLSLSLHAPNDEIRSQIMPITKAFSYEEVMAACRRYCDISGRRVVFEYALIRDLNCELRHADELAQKLRNLRCHVNLIPLNEVKERNLHAPSREQVNAFLKRLELRHISATVRREMGADIEGACGQLRRKVLENTKPE